MSQGMAAGYIFTCMENTTENKSHKVWQDKNHAKELYTEKVTWQKLKYIHYIPLLDKIVYNEKD